MVALRVRRHDLLPRFLSKSLPARLECGVEGRVARVQAVAERAARAGFELSDERGLGRGERKCRLLRFFGSLFGLALFLVFLTYPYKKQDRDKNFGVFSFLLSLIGFFCTLYIFFGYEGLVNRNGILLKNNFSILGNSFIFPTELIIGLIGIILSLIHI